MHENSQQQKADLSQILSLARIKYEQLLDLRIIYRQNEAFN